MSQRNHLHHQKGSSSSKEGSKSNSQTWPKLEQNWDETRTWETPRMVVWILEMVRVEWNVICGDLNWGRKEIVGVHLLICVGESLYVERKPSSPSWQSSSDPHYSFSRAKVWKCATFLCLWKIAGTPRTPANTTRPKSLVIHQRVSYLKAEVLLEDNNNSKQCWRNATMHQWHCMRISTP